MVAWPAPGDCMSQPCSKHVPTHLRSPFLPPAGRTVGWVHRASACKPVGDFVLRRADGLWAYQLAVVADDAAQGITDVVRGEDLADNTARQIVLQQALGFPRPRYLHTPLVLGANGEKLSKQNQAQPLPEGDAQQMLHNLQQAAQRLGLPPVPEGTALPDAQATWVQAWAARYNR